MGGPLANFAGLLHMTMHSLTKSAIFFAVGHVAQVKGTQRIADIRGLSVSHPVLAVGLALGVIAIAGLPPFGVFTSEFMLVSSTFARQPLARGRAGVRIDRRVRRADPAAAGRAVRRAERAVRPGQGDLCAAVSASRARADRRAVAAASRWCAGSAPSPRSWDDGCERTPRQTARGTHAGAGPPAMAALRDRRGQPGSTIAQALGEGGGDLLGLWAEKDNVHLAMRVGGRSRALRRLAADEELRLSLGRPLPRAGDPARARDPRPRTAPCRSVRRTGGPGSTTAPGACERRSARARRRCGAIRRSTISCRRSAKGCTRSRSGRCTPASSSPAISASPPTARPWCGWRSGSATSTRASTGCSPAPTSSARRKVVGAHLRRLHRGLQLAFARAVEEALQIDPPPRARSCAASWPSSSGSPTIWATSARSATTPSFSLIHAHCGIFRERVLAAADRAVRPSPDDGPHRAGRHRGREPRRRARACRPCSTRSRSRSPRSCGSMTTRRRLQDRTCNTGIVGKDLVEQWAAGGHVGRASGRDFDSRRDFPYAPYHDTPFEVPVFTAGDVDARVWVRIREIEQSLVLLKHWLANLPPGPVRVELPVRRSSPARASPSRRRSAAMCWSGCGSSAAGSPAATRATRRGSSGRCWRPRSRTTSSPTSRSATSRSTARIRGTTSDAHLAAEIAVRAAGDRSGAGARCGDAARGGRDPRRAWQGARSAHAPAVRPLDHHPRGRCRLLQRLRAGDPRAQQRGL